MLADPAVDPHVLGVELVSAQASSAAVASSGPRAAFSSKTFRPRARAQRKLTAVGRVLPRSSKTSSNRSASFRGSRTVRSPNTKP